METPDSRPPAEPTTHFHDPQAYLSAILEAAVEAVLVIDEQGTIELFGAAAERMFGYRAGEVIGRNVDRLMPSPDRERHDEYLRSYVRTGIAKIIGIGREVVAVRKDGTEFPADLSIGEIFGSGAKRRFVGLMRDITDRKETEKRLRQKDEELLKSRERLGQASRLSLMGEMAAGLAHEINQPLTAISSYARACSRMMEDGRGEESDYLAALEGINAQALRAGAVIRRLRAFVKKSDHQTVPTDLNELVEEVIKLARVGVRDSGLELCLDLDDSLPRALVDSVRIQQVLLNLVQNAVEASGAPDQPGDRIIVRTRRAVNGDAEFTVVDQGAGLSREAEEELFNPFFTTKDSGMGMGLAICRSIVEAHNGALWFTRNEGPGTTFHFTIPVRPEESNADS